METPIKTAEHQKEDWEPDKTQIHRAKVSRSLVQIGRPVKHSRIACDEEGAARSGHLI
jgi:hypothetical protein